MRSGADRGSERGAKLPRIKHVLAPEEETKYMKWLDKDGFARMDCFKSDGLANPQCHIIVTYYILTGYPTLSGNVDIVAVSARHSGAEHSFPSRKR